MFKFLTSLALAILFVASTCASPLTPAQVATSTFKSIIQVQMKFNDGSDGACTAFAVRPGGYYLTANHCIQEELTIDGKQIHLLRHDAEKDLAFFQYDTLVPQPPLTIRTRPLDFLEEVLGIGYAYGLTEPFVTFAHAEQFAFVPDSGASSGTHFEGAFIKGMSGGPIVDMSGQVVGIAQRSITLSSYGVNGQMLANFIK